MRPGRWRGRRKPVIVTCRPQSHGGHFQGSEEERRTVLAEALALGAEYVDLEWQGSCADLMERTGGRRVVLSHHDFTGIPANLRDMAQAMLGSGAEVVKIAVAASRLSDCLRLRAIGQQTRVPVSLIAMGEAGIPSRVLASWMGSCWTYAGEGIAPGQISERRMHDEFRFRRIGARTALYGILGKPVTHSVSPVMHNAAFHAAHVDAVHLHARRGDFEDCVTFADAPAWPRQLPLTLPGLRVLDAPIESDPVSRTSDSVNTLRRDGVKWLRVQHRRDRIARAARNRDAGAWRARGDSRRRWRGAIGVGGAGLGRHARHDCRAAAGPGTVGGDADRRRGVGVAARSRRLGSARECHARGHLTKRQRLPLPDGYLFHGGGLVYDLVYNPPQTKLLADAARAGCRQPDRRARHARGPGRAPVRMVDRSGRGSRNPPRGARTIAFTETDEGHRTRGGAEGKSEADDL